MEGLSSSARFVLIAGFILVAVGARLFGQRQNQGRRLGGAISRPKLIWLGLIFYGWFIVAPTLALEPAVPAHQIFYLRVFAGFVALRGLVELAMLYGTRTWRPVYGLGHSMASFLWMAMGAYVAAPADASGFASWTGAFILWIAVTAALETYYAYTFHRVVRGRASGDDNTWFGADGDPKFSWLNRITALGNVPVLIFLTITLIGVWRS